MCASRQHTVAAIAAVVGVSRAALYRALSVNPAAVRSPAPSPTSREPAGIHVRLLASAAGGARCASLTRSSSIAGAASTGSRAPLAAPIAPDARRPGATASDWSPPAAGGNRAEAVRRTFAVPLRTRPCPSS